MLLRLVNPGYPPRRPRTGGLAGLLVRLAVSAWVMATMLAAEAVLAPRQHLEKSWDVRDGLPDNGVNAVFQTRDGYLWIGTEKGLARFDGVQFRVFDPWNTKELHSERVSALCEDAGGDLWIGTKGGGVTRYREGEFKHIGLSSQFVSALCADRQQQVWIGTSGGGLFGFRDGSLVSYSATGGMPDLFVLAIHEAGDGRMLFGTRFAGLVEYRDGEFRPRVLAAGMVSGPVHALCEDGDGGMWLGTAAGLVRLDDTGSRVLTTRDGLPGDQVLAIVRDRAGNLWVGTKAGAVTLPLGRDEELRVERSWLRGETVSACLVDREGSAWLATAASGLRQLTAMTFAVLAAREGLNHDVVTCVMEDRAGQIWLGTYGGLNRWAAGALTGWDTRDGLANAIVTALLEDAAGDLWIGTQQGLNRFTQGRLEPCRPADGWPPGSVWAFHEDAEGTLWLGTADGLYERREGRITRHGVESGLPSQDIRALAGGREGRLWIGTAHGLALRHDGRFRPLALPSGSLTRIILCLREDPDGVLWCGTLGGGLIRLQAGTATAFTMREGLPDSTVYQILDDGEGWLWLTCNRGVFKVGRTELEQLARRELGRLNPRVFDRTDGLPSQECTGFAQPAGWRSADGRLWFPTRRGVAVLDPAQPRKDDRPPPVRLEQVVADNERLRPGNHVALKPGRERLEFHFVALSYAAPERVRFRYLLEGFDTEWTDAGARRVAYYTRVPPGRYRFRVTAGLGEQAWNEIGAVVAVTVWPKPWQTAWFRGGVVGALALAALGVHRWRLGRVRALDRLRLRLAQDLHDDLGASLTEIALMSDPEHPELKELGQARSHVGRIALKARLVVQTLNEIVWAVNPRNDNLPRLLDYLCTFSEELCEAAGVRCWHEVPVGLPARPLKVEFRHHLLLAVKEALQNVLKHAHATEVWLRVSVAGDQLEVVLTDNGRGFPAGAPRPRGCGLENMRTRLEQIGGWTEVFDAGQGTTVRFIAPLGGGRLHRPRTEAGPAGRGH
jgi:ligand-binding sensor domain-containing protein/signal transduction histidine kinase